MPSTSKSTSTTILLPDLVPHCTFDLHTDKNHKLVAAESKQWLFNGALGLDEATRRAFHGLKAGKLISMCYPHAGYPQLRVCNDFSNYLFHLDNLSDDMDDRSIENIANVIMNTIHYPHTYRSPARLHRMTKDYYKRIMLTATPSTCQRFKETMELYFTATQQQAIDRANGTIPDLESYITLRRNTSGCKPSFTLIEYAYHLNIPDDVMEHLIIRSLCEATNDFVSWSNDIFSYDVEHSKGQTHNMIDVIMHERRIGLQDAVNVVGDYCKHALDQFMRDRANIPSWNPSIDVDVRMYVEGLANWIVGSLHWSFESERYFGKAAKQIKATRLVTLQPKRNFKSAGHNGS